MALLLIQVAKNQRAPRLLHCALARAPERPETELTFRPISGGA
jgi:hypothetical protein